MVHRPNPVYCLALYSLQIKNRFYIFKWFEKNQKNNISLEISNKILISVSINKTVLEDSHADSLATLIIDDSCFYTITAGLSSCNRAHMAHKT